MRLNLSTRFATKWIISVEESLLPAFLTIKATGISPASASLALHKLQKESIGIKEEESAQVKDVDSVFNENLTAYDVTAASWTSGCVINRASKSAGAICNTVIINMNSVSEYVPHAYNPQ